MWRLRKESEMTTRKKTAPAKPKNRKLALERETIKDLDVKGKAWKRKGRRPHSPIHRNVLHDRCFPPANRK